SICLFFIRFSVPQRSTFFPYTTLFRSTDGIVTTVAGNGNPGFQDGTSTNAQFNVPVGICVGTDGYIFVADRQNRRIRRVTPAGVDRKSTRLNSSHEWISYAVFCLKKKK